MFLYTLSILRDFGVHRLYQRQKAYHDLNELKTSHDPTHKVITNFRAQPAPTGGASEAVLAYALGLVIYVHLYQASKKLPARFLHQSELMPLSE
jgi:hypothetical protein